MSFIHRARRTTPWINCVARLLGLIVSHDSLDCTVQLLELRPTTPWIDCVVQLLGLICVVQLLGLICVLQLLGLICLLQLLELYRTTSWIVS